MTLEIIYCLSQIIAVLAVVISLAFVGVQIRYKTIATKAASNGAVSMALNEINRLFAKNGDVTRIWLSGMGDRQALYVEARWRFDTAFRQIVDAIVTEVNAAESEVASIQEKHA